MSSDVPKFSLVVRYEIYDNDHGNKITVSEDADGLNLVEITDSETKLRLTMYPQCARLLADALLRTAKDVEAQA